MSALHSLCTTIERVVVALSFSDLPGYPWLHLKDHARFPRALITMKKSNGLSLIDGSHRMAAFFMVQELPKSEFEKLGKKKPSLKQHAWIGAHSAGEVPLT